MRPRGLLCGLSALAMVAGSGCGPETLAKRAFKEARGASAKVLDRSPIVDLAALDSLHLGEMGNRAMNLCPHGFVEELRRELSKALAASRVLCGDGTPGTIRLEIVHYESPDLIGAALAPRHQAVVLVSIIAEDGREVAAFTAVGESEALRTGPADLARAVARKLVEHLESCKTGKPQLVGVQPVTGQGDLPQARLPDANVVLPPDSRWAGG